MRFVLNPPGWWWLHQNYSKYWDKNEDIKNRYKDLFSSSKLGGHCSGIWSKSGNAGANAGNCKTNSALHCISVGVWSAAHAGLCAATADLSVPPAARAHCAPAAPRPPHGLCRASKALLKNHCIIRGKKRHQNTQKPDSISIVFYESQQA